jgi:hypothetical protein
MNDLRSVRPVRRCCGLLMGLLLALGPLAQSVAASQRPCGRAPASGAAPAAAETRAEVRPGAQWTCAETESVSAVRALPTERPDGSEGSGGTVASDRGAVPGPHWARRASSPPLRPLIAPVLAALRPVVLQI